MPLYRFRQLPVERLPRPTARPRAPRVQQEQVRLEPFERLERLSVTHPDGLHDRETYAPYSRYRLGRLVAVELREVQAGLAGGSQHLFRPRVHEDADLEDVVGQRDAYPARLLDIHPAGALGEDQADSVRTYVGCLARVAGVGYAANLSEDHTKRDCTPLHHVRGVRMLRPSLAGRPGEINEKIRGPTRPPDRCQKAISRLFLK